MARTLARSASATWGGTIPLTSPLAKAISLTRLELRKDYSWLAIRQTVSTSDSSLRLLSAN